MAEYFFLQGAYFEMELVFSTYTFKFESFQSLLQMQPVSQLFFQRFTNLHDYSSLPYLNFSDKLFAQIEIPDISSQNDYQKLFFTNLYQRNSDLDCIIAETIDENAEYIYLIIDQNRNSSIARIFNSCTLEVFQFQYQELWNISANAFVYIRNLQIFNSILEKQWIESLTSFESCKQNASTLQLKAVSTEMKLEKMIEENNKKSSEQKPVMKINMKIELPGIDCLLCCSNPKNIVFLPCGHVVACKSCTTERLDIILGKVINQRLTPRNCPVCKQAIKIAREVII